MALVEELSGVVDRIVYRSDVTGFTVARFLPRAALAGGITIVGQFPEIAAGEHLQLHGSWTEHPRYGRQFEVGGYAPVLPTTAEGLQQYLGSLEGIGPTLAERIITRFGTDAIGILDRSPEELRMVKGIGPQRLARIARSWNEHQETRELMLFLASHGVSTAHASKIFTEYGTGAIVLLQEDPYRLVEEIVGIGFKTADRIALKLGIGQDAPARLEAALVHALSAAANQGHVCLPVRQMAKDCLSLLNLGQSSQDGVALEQAFHRLVRAGRLIVEEVKANSGETVSFVYLPLYYHAEADLAERLRRIRQIRSPFHSGIEQLAASFREEERPEAASLYSREQREAMVAALTEKILILTGGPGTGKSTTAKGILHLLEELDMAIELAAPTGRAAKRLTEATGRPAQTLHRLLGYQPSVGFQFDETHPLKADAVLVDEISMVDLLLMSQLLRALRPEAHLILVGDADQLPSVGAGTVLSDLLTSKTIRTIKLTKIFRQARRSHIITNAHRILSGQLPELRTPKGSDFLFLEAPDGEHAASAIAQLATERLPQEYGFDSGRDLQVLAPMYRGAAGVDNLNRLLQEKLNHGASRGLSSFGKPFRLGDKVMQIRNDYVKDVFNGDIGWIVEADEGAKTLRVDFPDRGVVLYEADEIDQLILAYAITIHKSQGNEYPAVILSLLTEHYIMLQRNLLYTAITRAKDLVVVVGSRKAMAIAVKNAQPQHRYSLLSRRLMKHLD